MDVASAMTGVGGGDGGVAGGINNNKNNNYSRNVGSAFGSIAAADVVVMALYFAVLQAATRSKWPHKLFRSKRSTSESFGFDDGNECDNGMEFESKTASMSSLSAPPILQLRSAAKANTVNNHYRRDACIVYSTSLRQICYPSGTICPIVFFTTILQSPGTMCGFLALLGWMSAQIMIQFVIRQLQYRVTWPSLSFEEGESHQHHAHA